MILSTGSIFLFIVFYTACLIASLSSKRPFYKRMWAVASFVLGLTCVVTAFLLIAGVLSIVIAI